MKNFLIFLALLGGLVLFLNHQFPHALENQGGSYHLLYLVALLVLVSGGVIRINKSNWGQQAKMAGAWVGIFLIFMIGYVYKDVFLDSKIGSELMPGRTSITQGGEMKLHPRADGHFYIEGRINGERILFMIDTGASYTMLSQSSADRVGLIIPPDAKKTLFSTANGTTAGLAATVSEMRIGELEVENLQVYVNQGSIDTNLLGMNFLQKLSSYSVENGVMTLAP